MKYRSLGGVVVAGCIAGVVAACAEPLAQGVGQAIAGAGGALAGAGAELGGHDGSGFGAALSGAGAALGAAGRALAGTGGTGGTARADTTTDAGTDTGAVPAPNPRWVLRDKDGAAVPAVVNPGYTTSLPRFGSTRDCVGISHYGQRHIDLSYELATGAVGARATDVCPSPIVAETAEWHVAAAVWRYSDAACTKPIASNSQYLFSVAGRLYHSGTGAPTVPATLYGWTSYGACEGVPNTAQYWAVEPVPADVVNLLPNPPYSLELVY